MEGKTMKRILTLVAVFVFAFSLVSASTSQAVDYEAFSKNLVKALKSENQGLQVSAMQQVIKYNDKVNVDDAIIELVRVYRRHSDERFRRLALATISATQNEWALGIVKRDFQFEKNLKVKKMMAAVIGESRLSTTAQ